MIWREEGKGDDRISTDFNSTARLGIAHSQAYNVHDKHLSWGRSMAYILSSRAFGWTFRYHRLRID